MSLPCDEHIVSWLSKIYRHTKRKLSFRQDKKRFTFWSMDTRNNICNDTHTIFTIRIIICNDKYVRFLISNTSHLWTFKHISFSWRTKHHYSSSARDSFHKGHGAVKRIRCMSKINEVIYSPMSDLLHASTYSMK